MLFKQHSPVECKAGYYDNEYEIRTDSDGDWTMHEVGVSTYSNGDPKQFALIKYCPFCGKNLDEK